MKEQPGSNGEGDDFFSKLCHILVGLTSVLDEDKCNSGLLPLFTVQRRHAKCACP
jgi:hypothetical protein